MWNPRLASSCLMDFKVVFVDGSEHIYDNGSYVCQFVAVQFNAKASVGLR
jgi:hypothetical protein